MTRRWWVAMVAGAGVALQLGVYAGLVASMAATRRFQDFALFYADARTAVVDYENPYERPVAPTGADGEAPINLNPPLFLLVVAPLTALSPLPAFLAWTALGVLSAAAAVRVIFRESGIRPASLAGLGLVGVVIAGAPTGALLLAGQVTWLFWWPLCWVWATARRGRWFVAGVGLGVLASFKPFLFALVPFLAVQRRWRATLALTLAAFTSYLIGVWVFGWPMFQAWLVNLRSITWSKMVFNASIFGTLERAFSDRPALAWDLAPVTIAPALVVPLWLVLSAIVLAISVRWVHREIASSNAADRVFAVGLITALLISPVGWIYYHFLFVGPVVALAVSSQWWSTSRLRRVLLAGFALPLVLSPGMLAAGQPNGWLSLTLGSLYFWSLVALWTCVVLPGKSEVRSEREEEVGSRNSDFSVPTSHFSIYSRQHPPSDFRRVR